MPLASVCRPCSSPAFFPCVPSEQRPGRGLVVLALRLAPQPVDDAQLLALLLDELLVRVPRAAQARLQAEVLLEQERHPGIKGKEETRSCNCDLFINYIFTLIGQLEGVGEMNQGLLHKITHKEVPGWMYKRCRM